MSTGTDRDPALQLLLDKQTIQELIYRWARGLDRLDAELTKSCYHEGATEKHGTYDGPADEFVGRAAARFTGDRPFLTMSHHVSNVLVDVDGDRARSECYYLAAVVLQDGNAEVDVFIGGRYLDQIERREGRWGFTHRETVFDWSRVQPASARWWDWQYGSASNQLLRGTCGPDDPLYARLQIPRG